MYHLTLLVTDVGSIVPTTIVFLTSLSDEREGKIRIYDDIGTGRLGAWNGPGRSITAACSKTEKSMRRKGKEGFWALVAMGWHDAGLTNCWIGLHADEGVNN